MIAGERDLLVPAWKSEEIAQGIPGAKLSVVPRAPHGINVERAEEFNALVLEFLAGVSGSAQAPAPASTGS